MGNRRSPVRGRGTISLIPVTGTSEKFVNAQLEVECKTTTTAVGSIFGGSGMELRTVKFANCTVPSPAGCSVTGGTITPRRQLAILRWSADTGEAASLSFIRPDAPTPIVELAVGGGGCTVAGTYKMVGEYVGEIIISATEQSTKQFLMKCPTPIGSYWFGAQRRTQIELREPLKNRADGVPRSGQILRRIRILPRRGARGEQIQRKSARLIACGDRPPAVPVALGAAQRGTKRYTEG